MANKYNSCITKWRPCSKFSTTKLTNLKNGTFLLCLIFLKRGYNFSFSFLQIQFPKSRSKKSDPDWHQRFISNILKRYKALEMEASTCTLVFLTFIFKFCTYMNLWFGIPGVFLYFFLNLFSPFFRIGKTRIICQINVHDCDETHTKEMGGRHILQID